MSSLQQRKYATWLIRDQCKELLNMTNQQIADVIGISRPTLDTRLKDYGSFSINELEKIEEWLGYIKVALLTTESSDIKKEYESE